MCGIAGIYAFNDIGSFYMINHAKATDSLAQRGPDARGYFVDDNVALGHRRLAIIDTTYQGNQPIYDHSERYVIVFNGEIFNYKSLRQSLQNNGVNFVSESDTEVLLYLLIHEGVEALNKVNGFFSFALWDKEKKELLVARDRFGIKPLVYYKDEDKFVFGSEMKSLTPYNIPKEIDLHSVSHYFQFSYIPSPYTIYKNYYNLEPGHYMVVKNNQWMKLCYYTNSMVEQLPYQGSYEDAQSHLSALLENAVKDRLVADVPLGSFLSGGIDSSIVAALASKHTKHLHTFSVGYEHNKYFDETKYAHTVAKKIGTDHTVYSLTHQDLAENVHDVLNYLDEPFGDSSALPFYILSKKTKSKVTVALSGDGADELFGGYERYKALDLIDNPTLKSTLGRTAGFIISMFKKDFGRNSSNSNLFRKLVKFSELNDAASFFDKKQYPLSDDALRYLFVSSHYVGNKLDAIFTPSFLSQQARVDERVVDRLAPFVKNKKSSLLANTLETDLNMVLLSDMLYKVDRMSMANALEVRVPFLDYQVVEFARSLPANFKIEKGQTKKILKDAFFDLLPPEIWQRSKKGFEVPLADLYRTTLKDKIKNEYFDDDFIQSQGIFDLNFIKYTKQQLLSNGTYDQQKVWHLIAFQSWWLKNVK